MGETEISWKAKWLFSDALQAGPEGVLKEYRHHVKFFHRLKKKLKNPLHHKTGKPLSPSTIRQYQEHELPWRLGCLNDTKQAIQMLIASGIIQNKKPKIKPGKVVFLHGYRQKREVERCVADLLERMRF